MKRFFSLLVFMLGLLPALAMASTLADVKARGTLKCGVNPGLAGFALKGTDGQWQGFDVDYCRAVAAAVLGDASKVEFVASSTTDRFDKLAKGEVDILARNTTWTMERETKTPLRFVGISYHDGQGFLVPKSIGVTSAYQLNQAAVCFLSGTTTQANVEDLFKLKNMTFTPVTFGTIDELVAAFQAKGETKCDAYSADQSQLYAVRLKLAKPDQYVILPEVISKEPLGPAVRQGDEQWFTITRWVLFALINGEELGVKAKTADDMKANDPRPELRRLLGAEGSFGTDMGLDNDWALRALKAVGNYGEVFERNLGKATLLGIARGLNAAWNDGGILYAPPVR